MFLQGTWAWRVKIGQIEQKPRRGGGDVAFSVLWVPQIKIPSTHRDRRWIGIPSSVPGSFQSLPCGVCCFFCLRCLCPLPVVLRETAQWPVSLSICSLALWFLDWCAPCDQQAPRSWGVKRLECVLYKGGQHWCRTSAGEWQLAWEGGLFALETSSERFKKDSTESAHIYERQKRNIAPLISWV